MKLFVIHRSAKRNQAKRLLKDCSKIMAVKFNSIFLDSYDYKDWKEEAINALSKVEAVIIYDRQSCEESENAKWEIKKAEEVNIPIIEISIDDKPSFVCSKLIPIYNLEKEFDSCFRQNSGINIIDLYKIMIESSESLIKRRQNTNAFFITVIGSLLSIAGLMVKSGALYSDTIWLLYGLSIVGLLLCNSWRNLIDNYGKLNKAKFDVILKMERELDASIFAAEWISLGKGLRPQKYKSFTSTEKNVPLYFSILIAVLTLMAIYWQIWG